MWDLLEASVPGAPRQFAVCPSDPFPPATRVGRAITFLPGNGCSLVRDEFSLSAFTGIRFQGFLFVGQREDSEPAYRLFVSARRLIHGSFPIRRGVKAVVGASYVFCRCLRNDEDFLCVRRCVVLVMATVRAYRLLSIGRGCNVVARVLCGRFLFTYLICNDLVICMARISSRVFR